MPRGDTRRAFEYPRTSRPAVGATSFVTVFRDRIVLVSSGQRQRLQEAKSVRRARSPSAQADIPAESSLLEWPANPQRAIRSPSVDRLIWKIGRASCRERV